MKRFTIVSCFVLIFVGLSCSASVPIDMTAWLNDLGGIWPGYTVHMEIGTPSQGVEMLVDGGLDLLFVFTPNCTERGCGLAYYYPEDSTTLTLTSETLNYTYAAGNLNVVGNIGTDFAIFGGLLDDNQPLGLINELSQPKYYPPSADYLSGVFGFAYPSPSLGELSIVQNIIQQNPSVPYKMSIWLPKNIYDSGILTLGDENSNLYTGDLNYIPLQSSSWAKKDYPFFWSNVIDDIKVNGVSNGYCSRKTCNFFIDLAARPMDLANSISPIHVNSDCSNMNQLDKYTLVIGGIDYDLTPQDYVIQYQDGNSTKCESGIFTSKIPYPFTLGYTWIRNYFTVFDFENQQIGFASSASQ